MKRAKFNDYDGFVDKFKPKKTTDDCYTPPAVYDAVLDFVHRTWALPEKTLIVRPFYPGGDYKAYTYPDGCVVVDNPPFSILAEIIRHYCRRGTPFFIFAPSLTLFSARDCDVTYIITNSTVVYENGAKVKTGFITNLPSDLRVWCCVELASAIESAQAEPPKQKRCFVYPDNLVTAATLQKLVAHQTELKIRKDECVAVSSIDNARKGRDIYGGGFLLSERAAAERITLSVREVRIIRQLDARAKEAADKTT